MPRFLTSSQLGVATADGVYLVKVAIERLLYVL